MTTLTITRPDDWHVHLRDGEVLADTVRDISRYNGRALIMPNTVPPVTNSEMAIAYRNRIMAEQPSAHFEPLMALYLTDNTTPDDIREAKRTGAAVAAKLYPAVQPRTQTQVLHQSKISIQYWRQCRKSACCCWFMVR